MKKILSIAVVTILSFFGSAQVITMGNTMTPEQLVNNMLVGQGVTISNVTFNGSAANAQAVQPNALDFSATGFPFTSGLYLRTSGGASVSFDPDLNAISTNTITNGAILEFDFIPSGDSLVFNYMFASAEYPTYVCSGFNDVFGFFISGPGISGPYSNGAVNIALVPGTNVPVAINTVNSGVAGSAGSPATCAAQDPNWTSNSIYYTTAYANYSGEFYNGGTVALPALVGLQCGQTYHIKLAVSNVGDTALDSGVYIEGNSFTSNAVEIAIATVTGDTTVYEGCTDADLMFIRPGSQTSDTLIVNYSVTGTATSGLDYPPIPNPVTFYPGDDTVTLNVSPIADGIPDDNEYITITAITVSPCGDTLISTGTLYFRDSLPMPITEPDPVLLCKTDDSVQVTVSSTGGFQPYTYDWSDGQTGATVTFPGINGPNQSIDYIVTATASCGGYTNTDTVTITLNQTLVIDSLVMTPTDGCGNANGSVQAYASGKTEIIGQAIQLWQDTTGTMQPGTSWQNIGSGWYYFTVDDDVCQETDSIFVEMENAPQAAFTVTPSAGCSPLNVNMVNNSINTNDYDWDFGDGTNANVGDESSQSNTYTVTSTITLTAYQNPNCFDVATQQVTVVICGCTDPEAENYDPNAQQDDGSCFYPTPEVIVPNVFTPNGDMNNDIFNIKTKNAVKIEVTILNRWGNVMYDESTDLTTVLFPQLVGWTGITPGGAAAEEGTYFYKYIVTGINGDTLEGHGFLQLVRD